MRHYTMSLHEALEAETGQGCGVFRPGSLYLARTEDRAHQLRLQAARARAYGMAFHEISRDAAERLHPLVDFDGIRSIMFEPDGGNVDPSGVSPTAPMAMPWARALHRAILRQMSAPAARSR